MSKSESRAIFGKVGVILATAGSAIGLGNIWRFPYMTGQNGGAAFILLYLFCVFLLGIPGMVAEFVVGRHGASNAARAYHAFGKSPLWSLVGGMGIFSAMLILGFYSVVAGWCLQYLYAATSGQLQGNLIYIQDYFVNFSQKGWISPLCAVLFVIMTHYVVIRGVRGGIERASNILMPVLFVLLGMLAVVTCALPGAVKGIEFLLYPDFSHLSKGVFLDALGQAFFSLSLGSACLCTYASYFSRQTNLLKSSIQIASLDTFVAIMAGLIIFPAAFSVGISPDSGPSLIFITLPNVFNQAFSGLPWLGYCISVLFYALLVLAALTSTISMHEIGTSFFREELHVKRTTAATIVTVICCTIAVLCSLSMNPDSGVSIFGKGLLDFCDFLTGQIFLPLGSLLTCIFIGWVVPQEVVKDEFTNWGTLPAMFYKTWLFMVRFVSPICIVVIFLHQLGLV